jgi:hypothetical protein
MTKFVPKAALIFRKGHPEPIWVQPLPLLSLPVNIHGSMIMAILSPTLTLLLFLLLLPSEN